MTGLLLLFALATQEPAILCPPCPGDPPWRPITCFILSRLEPWDRTECEEEVGR